MTTITDVLEKHPNLQGLGIEALRSRFIDATVATWLISETQQALAIVREQLAPHQADLEARRAEWETAQANLADLTAQFQAANATGGDLTITEAYRQAQTGEATARAAIDAKASIIAPYEQKIRDLEAIIADLHQISRPRDGEALGLIKQRFGIFDADG